MDGVLQMTRQSFLVLLFVISPVWWSTSVLACSSPVSSHERKVEVKGASLHSRCQGFGASKCSGHARLPDGVGD